MASQNGADGVGQAQMVELLYATPPAFQEPVITTVLNTIQETLPTSALLPPEGTPGARYVHPDLVQRDPDGRQLPIGTAVMLLDPPSGRPQRDTSQTWEWDDADAAIGSTTASMLVSELVGVRANRHDRLLAFRTTLLATVEATRPIATFWPNSKLVVHPATLREFDLVGSINVRMFNVGNGELLMDTLGLHVFGLPDVQLHFVGFDPAEVAPALKNMAAYLFTNGDVIDDGNTVPGLTPGASWTCRRAPALITPSRAVIDIDPGGSARPASRQP